MTGIGPRAIQKLSTPFAMPRPFAPIAAALVLAASLPGSAWAGGAFNKTLPLQGVSFQVQATGEGSKQQLTITPR